MIDMTLAVMIAGGTGLLSIGGAYGAVKQAMNGTKDRVKVLEIENKDTADRLARRVEYRVFYKMNPPAGAGA